MKKSKIPKLCQDIGLGKRLDVYFTRTATKSVRQLSRRFSWGLHHASHTYRLKINEDVNSKSEYLTKKGIHLPIV